MIPGTPPCLQKHGDKKSADAAGGSGAAAAATSKKMLGLGITGDAEPAPEAAASDSAPEGNVAEQPSMAARGRQVFFT